MNKGTSLFIWASDLNPVAVLINKAMIELPPRFAGQPPVHPDARSNRELLGTPWRGARGLAEDVRRYGRWMRDEAERRIGRLYPRVTVTPEMVRERPDLRPYEGRALTVIAWLWARTVRSPNPAEVRERDKGCALVRRSTVAQQGTRPRGPGGDERGGRGTACRGTRPDQHPQHRPGPRSRQCKGRRF